MGLLLEAAYAWQNLHNTEYMLLLSHKGKNSFNLHLVFPDVNFYHLCGMQYAKDVDFGRKPSEFFGKKLLSAVVDKQIDDERIEFGMQYESKIKGRLKAIINLENTLDGEFQIAKFSAKKVAGYCSIQADYVIKNVRSGEVFFVFVQEDINGAFCKSAFENNTVDYMANQSKLTVLKRTKIVNNVVVSEYTHPHYDCNR